MENGHFLAIGWGDDRLVVQCPIAGRGSGRQLDVLEAPVTHGKTDDHTARYIRAIPVAHGIYFARRNRVRSVIPFRITTLIARNFDLHRFLTRVALTSEIGVGTGMRSPFLFVPVGG